MKRLLLVGVAGFSLLVGVASASAGWLEETNGSGSMYLPPRVRPGAAVNYLDGSRARSDRASDAYEVGVYPQPIGPPILAAPPGVW